MTDYTTQNNTNSAPLIPPLTSDYNTPNSQTPFSQNNANQNQSSIKVNQQQPYAGNGISVTYRTPCKCVIYIIICHSLFLIILGTTIFIIMFSQNVNILIYLFPLIITLIGLLMGICNTLGTSINVEPYFGIITITDKKLFCCFNRKRKVQINQIQQIIVESYVSRGDEYDYNYSKLMFKLVDGKEVKGFDMFDDDKKEGRNAFVILRSGVPQNIPFGGNLAH